MNKFFSIIVTALCALLLISSPAFARNEVVNGWFQNGTAISPIQGGTGIANWKMTRPDNQQTMYFEQCWHNAGKGYACKYEVLIDFGNNMASPAPASSNVTADVNVSVEWSGIFESFTTIGGVPHATVTVNGVKQTNAYTVCEVRNGQHGRGVYCK